ncbi:MAG TPA: class I SAM-dependent methyltransferase [Longimicrobium sp.]
MTLPRGVRPWLEAGRRRFPRAYWRARTVVSLAEWYAQRLRERFASEDATAYGGGFWEQHQAGDWDGFARAILRRFPARSVLDVGCGDGKLLAAMLRADPSLTVLGVESSPAALAMAAARGVPVRELDLVRLRRRAVASAVPGDFALATSLEVAEHVPAWHSGKLLRLLARSPVVVFSAAQPNQGGTLHVNERPVEHWVRRFGRLGFAVAPENAAFRRDVAALDLPPWYAANVNAFVRR